MKEELIENKEKYLKLKEEEAELERELNFENIYQKILKEQYEENQNKRKTLAENILNQETALREKEIDETDNKAFREMIKLSGILGVIIAISTLIITKKPELTALGFFGTAIGTSILDICTFHIPRIKKYRKIFDEKEETKKTLENIKLLKEYIKEFDEIIKETKEKVEENKKRLHELANKLYDVKKQIREIKNNSYDQLINHEETQELEDNQKLILK